MSIEGVERFLAPTHEEDTIRRTTDELRSQEGRFLAEVAQCLVSDVSRFGPLGELALSAELVHAASLAQALRDPDGRDGFAPDYVIAGLPRSGTTFLQELLSSYGWPTPLGRHLAPSRLGSLGRHDAIDEELAARETDDRYDALDAVAPVVGNMHPLGSALPEECTPLFAASGRFFPWTLMFDSPSATDAIVADFGAPEAHAVWRRAMSLLGPRIASVVKSPLHTPYLSSLHNASPTSRLLVVRRRLEDVMRSFGTMIFHVRAGFFEEASPSAAGSHAQLIVWAMAQAARIALDDTGVEVTAVDFDRLIHEPDQVVSRISGPSRRLVRPSVRVQPPAASYRLIPLEELSINHKWCGSVRELVPELCQ